MRAVLIIALLFVLLAGADCHTVYVQISEASLVASERCKLPTEITATVRFGDISLLLQLKVNKDVDMSAPIFTATSPDNTELAAEQVMDIQDSAVYQDLTQNAAMAVTCTRKSDKTVNLVLHGFLTYNEKQYILENSHRSRRYADLILDADQYEMTEDIRPVFVDGDEISSAALDPQQTPDDNPTVSQLQSVSRTSQKTTASQYYIDVMVLIDYSVYTHWFNRSTQTTSSLRKHDALQNIRRYFAYIMNGVNLRYKSISGLSSVLNIRLRGYFVAETADLAPWSEKYKQTGPDRPLVDADNVLDFLRDWIPKSSLPKHDHAMLFTGYDIFRLNATNGEKNKNVTGVAYVGVMCLTDGSSSSLVEDFGGFQSVETAAHELGHSLGSKHDGDGNSCKATDRYIMAGNTYNTTADNINHPWFFSTCSVDYFRSYLANLTMSRSGVKCLTGRLTQKNVPILNNTLPGQLYTPDQQCKMLHGDLSYLCQGINASTSSGLCTRMDCWEPSTNDTCYIYNGARGTSCGDKRWCIDGLCKYSPDAPHAVDGCVYGDQSGLAIKNKTCADFLTAENSIYCYEDDVAIRCCASCAKLHTNVADCPYGDKFRGCTISSCGYTTSNDTALYRDDCCQTCAAFTRAVNNVLPGQIYTPDQQCKILSGNSSYLCLGKAFGTYSRVCTKMDCLDPSSDTCLNNYAAQGTSCGDKQWCIDGVCQYSQHAPSAVDGCVFGDQSGLAVNNKSCVDFIVGDNAVYCYDEDIRARCCASCGRYYTGVADCPYGNKLTGCEIRSCGYIDSNGTHYNDNCCQTCQGLRTAVNNTLPGQLYTPDQQCTIMKGTSSRMCQGPVFGTSTEVCTKLYCLDPSSSDASCSDHYAAQGTSCGDKRWCVDGVCQYSVDAPNAVDGCVFGDQAGIAFQGKSCADFLKGENSVYCNQKVVQRRCCASCRKYYTGVADCPYGDKSLGCDVSSCDYVDAKGIRYDVDCCGTCGTYTTTTSPAGKDCNYKCVSNNDCATHCPGCADVHCNLDSDGGSGVCLCRIPLVGK